MNKNTPVRLYNVPSRQTIESSDEFHVTSTSTTDDLVLENELIQAVFSPATGYLQYILDKVTKSKTKVTFFVRMTAPCKLLF